VFRETERVTPLELFFDPRLRPGDHTVHRADGRRTDLGGGRPRRPVVVLGLAGGTAIGVSGGGPTRDHVPRGYRGATPEGAMMGVTSVGHARCARPQFINPCGEARCSLLVGYGTADCFATRADASPGAGWRAGGLRVRARGLRSHVEDPPEEGPVCQERLWGVPLLSAAIDASGYERPQIQHSYGASGCSPWSDCGPAACDGRTAGMPSVAGIFELAGYARVRDGAFCVAVGGPRGTRARETSAGVPGVPLGGWLEVVERPQTSGIR
jgi:hypothetical protein